jgi:hypothetical protein
VRERGWARLTGGAGRLAGGEARRSRGRWAVSAERGTGARDREWGLGRIRPSRGGEGFPFFFFFFYFYFFFSFSLISFFF